MSEQKSTEVPLDKVIPAPSNDTDGAEQGIVTSASSRENKDINQDEAAFERISLKKQPPQRGSKRRKKTCSHEQWLNMTNGKNTI